MMFNSKSYRKIVPNLEHPKNWRKLAYNQFFCVGKNYFFMQKSSKIKINLFMKGFQSVPSQVACSKLSSFTALHYVLCLFCLAFVLSRVCLSRVCHVQGLSCLGSFIIPFKGIRFEILFLPQTFLRSYMNGSNNIKECFFSF